MGQHAVRVRVRARVCVCVIPVFQCVMTRVTWAQVAQAHNVQRAKTGHQQPPVCKHTTNHTHTYMPCCARV